MTMFYRAVAAGLGAALFQTYVTPRLPASVTGALGGTVGRFGGPVAGAYVGLAAMSMLKK